MGSSPFTATSSSHLLSQLETFLGHLADDSTGRARCGPAGRCLLVAFSGGPDSTALLWGLSRLAERFELALHAAHLDHRLDSDSGRRARRAVALARGLGVACELGTLDEAPPRGVSLEAFARERRYGWLQGIAEARGAAAVVTAHHADDQAETVLLRLLFGSGLDGLAAMAGRRDLVHRPLLGLRRHHLAAGLAASGLEAIDDPTNADERSPRNRVRHRLLPRLEAADPDIVPRLWRLAATAAKSRAATDRRLARELDAAPELGGASVDADALARLPRALLPAAFGLLSRSARNPYPIAATARREALRQLRAGHAVGCDVGDGWRLVQRASRLVLTPTEPGVGDFTYTVTVPGAIIIPELALRLRIGRRPVAPWMFRGLPDRTALAGPIASARRIEVRNRRPGDRIHPLGFSGHRRLKEVLIDRRIPRHRRSRLPLLVVDGEIAWVPGVTIGDRFRLTDETQAWVAEIEAINPVGSASDGRMER